MSKRSYSQLYYHFVWSTKNRKKLIKPDWENHLYGLIKEKCTEYGYDFVCVGGISDHVHLLVRLSPDIPPAIIAQKLKGVSSHFINNKSLTKEKFSWQEGYGVFSVSNKDVKGITQYIKKQKQHHKDKTIKENIELTENEEE